MLSCVWLFAPLWTVARQAPLSMGFSRQESWSGLPFPSPRDLCDPGNQTHISWIGRQILYHCTTWEAYSLTKCMLKNKTWKSKLPLDPRAAWWKLCWQTWKHGSHCPSTSDLLGDQVHVNKQQYFERNLFSQQLVSTVGWKYSVNHVVNRCAVFQALWFHWQNTGRGDLA